MDARPAQQPTHAPAGSPSRHDALQDVAGIEATSESGNAPADDGRRTAVVSFGAALAVEPIEPDAGRWRTWLLASGDEMRPPPPPGAAETRAELDRVRAMGGERSRAAASVADPGALGATAADQGLTLRDPIAYWDAGAPGYRWNEIATRQTLTDKQGAGDAYRTMAYLNAAIHDATIAAWDAKYAYGRPRPAGADPTLRTAVPTPASPSYPCERAVAAGAAAAVLGHLFPDEADAFAGLAAEAAESRVRAGVAYPSDAAAGLALGRAVGARFVERARADGSDAVFDPATMPSGPGLWSPRLPANAPPGDPAYPMLGTWKTWVLAAGDQFRPGPPPAPDSPERAAEIAAVKRYRRDAHPFAELFFWPQAPDSRPQPDSAPFCSSQAVFHYAPLLHFVWGPELAQKLFEYRLDANPPRAARAYALVSVAAFDATVAAWDAKFHYWTARPNQFDPEIATILPTYPMPDYPSAHAATLGGAAQVLASLFPADARCFQSRAEENAASRVWAGIHFPSASAAGLEPGRTVGRAVVAWAAGDEVD